MTIPSFLQPEAAVGSDFMANPTGKNVHTRDFSQKGFDQYLATLDKADRAERPPVEKKPDSTRDKKTNDRTERDQAPEKEKPYEREEPRTSATKDTQSKKDVKAASSEKTLDETVESAEEEIVARVAEILQVPPDVLMQWLASLNMRPLDLTDPAAIGELVQKALGITTPGELLTTPDFSALFEAVKQAMVDFQSLSDLVKQSNALEKLQNLQVIMDESNQPVVVSATAQDATETTEATALAAAGLTDEQTGAESDALADIALEDTAQPARAATSVTALEGSAQQTATGSQEDALANGNPMLAAMTDADLESVNGPVSNALFGNIVSRQADAASAVRTANPVDATDVMNQIMSRVRMQSGDQFAELRITLRPENLGDVSLRVLTQNGVVTAQFVAENQRVKEVIEANFNQLKDVLQQQGVQVSELSVSVRQEDNGERMNQFLRAQQSGRRRLQRITNRASEAEVEAIETERRVDPSEVLLNSVDFTA